MNKEIEGICKWLQSYVDSSKKTGQGHSTIVVYNEVLEKTISQLRSHTEPPTSEQVCKALSEYITNSFIDNADVVECTYDKKTKSFIDSNPHFTTIVRMKYNKIQFAYVLPPHLITMIGEFYEEELRKSE